MIKPFCKVSPKIERKPRLKARIFQQGEQCRVFDSLKIHSHKIPPVHVPFTLSDQSSRVKVEVWEKLKWAARVRMHLPADMARRV